VWVKCNAASGLWPLDLIGFCLKFLEHPGLLKPGYLLPLVYMVLLSITQELCCNGLLPCFSWPHLFQWYYLQEAATAISEEVSILRTDEPDSRVIMSGQREVSTASIMYQYLINMSYKHCEVSLSTFSSLFLQLSPVFENGSYTV